MVWGDPDKVSYSYRFDEERSKVLYSSLKQPLPNIFQGTAFKKHITMLIEEKQTQEKSQLFFFLLYTTDRKGKLNNFFGNVNLHTINCPYEEFSKYSSKGNSFLSQDLDSKIPNLREVPWEIVLPWEIILQFMKHVVQISNSNLIQNTNALWKIKQKLIAKLNLVGLLTDSHPQNQIKLKLGY